MSPFKTVFVVDEKTGRVLYALSQNVEYAKRRKKKNGGGPSNPQPSSRCCQICEARGGRCQPMSDGSCICFGGSSGGGSEPLDVDGALDSLDF